MIEIKYQLQHQELISVLQKIKESINEYRCLHCGRIILHNNHNFHEGECYCQDCDDWNNMGDCFYGDEFEIEYKQKSRQGWISYIKSYWIGCIPENDFEYLVIENRDIDNLKLDEIIRISSFNKKRIQKATLFQKNIMELNR